MVNDDADKNVTDKHEPAPDAAPARKPRGFAAMSKEKQRELASKGGKAAHAKGTAHKFTPEEASVAGRKGGIASHHKRRGGSSAT
ncbi:MAG TPA: KGG domain-containing protein [Candidatus Binatia bacterium]|nr:KGG domain-containing protein [Candidatus Binatia bacterium]